MAHIIILTASIRTGRHSDRVGLYFKNYLETHQLATPEVVDLKTYNFPLFEERLRLQTNPAPETLAFAEKIKSADGVIIVTPEYNGGYPASLKNVIDLLYAEWYKKPVGIVTVSDGVFGGTQVLTSLQFTLWKMRAWTIPAMFPVPSVATALNEAGVPADPAGMDKRAAGFLKELLWCIEANNRMKGA